MMKKTIKKIMEKKYRHQGRLLDEVVVGHTTPPKDSDWPTSLTFALHVPVLKLAIWAMPKWPTLSMSFLFSLSNYSSLPSKNIFMAYTSMILCKHHLTHTQTFIATIFFYTCNVFYVMQSKHHFSSLMT
jgi:hypothetical protein